jgi:hypothetical protein
MVPGPFHLWLIGGDWRKISFDDRHRHSFKMAASATILDFVLSIISPTPGLTGSICLWLIGSDWRKVPFDDQRRLSFKMAATVPILDLVSGDYLTNAWVDWLSPRGVASGGGGGAGGQMPHRKKKFLTCLDFNFFWGSRQRLPSGGGTPDTRQRMPTARMSGLCPLPPAILPPQARKAIYAPVYIS